MEKINGNLTEINSELQHEISEIRKVLDNTNEQFGKLVNFNSFVGKQLDALFNKDSGSVKEVFSENGAIGSMMKNTFTEISHTIELIEKSTLTNTATSDKLIKLMSSLTESINELNKQILMVNESNKQNLTEDFIKKQGRINNMEEKTDILPDVETK